MNHERVLCVLNRKEATTDSTQWVTSHKKATRVVGRQTASQLTPTHQPSPRISTPFSVIPADGDNAIWVGRKGRNKLGHIRHRKLEKKEHEQKNNEIKNMATNTPSISTTIKQKFGLYVVPREGGRKDQIPNPESMSRSGLTTSRICRPAFVVRYQ